MRARNQERRQRLGSLRTVPLFSRCSDEELGLIDELLTEVSVRPGRTLTSGGASSLQFLIVREGYARVISGGRDIGRVGPGSHVGARSVWGEGWKASVVALTPMRVLVMNAGELATMLATVPSLKEQVESGQSPSRQTRPVLRTGLARA